VASVTESEIVQFVEQHIGQFHASRLEALFKLRLKKILARKNPYLFKAKYLNSAPDLIKTILDAHLSSQEETIFGTFLEELARFICGKVYGGKKSAAEGIDLEFEKDGVWYLVSLKSGPKWGNSEAVKRMVESFNKAKKILGTNTRGIKVVCVNGCCYGKEKNIERKGNYLKLCGQRFWEFVSGDQDFYVHIIEPLGHKAKEKNEQFQLEYGKIITKFTLEFTKGYCAPDGAILWARLTQFNSGIGESSI